MDKLRGKRNLADHSQEKWRPPLLRPVTTPGDRLAHKVRGFFDLQSGSIWADLAAILPYEKGSVLDVGCGSQPYRILLPKEAAYIGIDQVNAKAHFGYQMPDTLYYEGTVWPIDSSSVDTVICTETLEHVPNPPEFLSEAKRVLRPGGTLLLTVPFSARWHFIPHDYWRYTPSALTMLLRSAGFSDIEVYARGNEWTVAFYKTMTVILSLLFSQNARFMRGIALRLAGLLLSPLLILCAVAANVSLASKEGDDCLGYTVLSRRMRDIDVGDEL